MMDRKNDDRRRREELYSCGYGRSDAAVPLCSERASDAHLTLSTTSITNGRSQQVPTRYSGFMENVRPCPFVAGSGKSILWFVEPSLFLSTVVESLVFLQFDNYRSVKIMCDTGQSLDIIFRFRFLGHHITKSDKSLHGIALSFRGHIFHLANLFVS